MNCFFYPFQQQTNDSNTQKPAIPYGGPYFSPNSPYGFVLPQPMPQYTGQHGNIQYIPVSVPIQTEYEGFLFPMNPQTKSPAQSQPQLTPPPPPPTATQNAMENIKSPNTDLIIAVLRSVLPRNLVHFIVNWGTMIANFFSVVVFGGLMTTAICTLTPLCSISFAPLAFGFRNGFPSDASNQTTLQRIRRGTEMLNSALVKFERMQRDVEQ